MHICRCGVGVGIILAFLFYISIFNTKTYCNFFMLYNQNKGGNTYPIPMLRLRVWNTDEFFFFQRWINGLPLNWRGAKQGSWGSLWWKWWPNYELFRRSYPFGEWTIKKQSLILNTYHLIEEGNWTDYCLFAFFYLSFQNK